MMTTKAYMYPVPLEWDLHWLPSRHAIYLKIFSIGGRGALCAFLNHIPALEHAIGDKVKSVLDKELAIGSR